MKLEELVGIIDPLTWVEVSLTRDRMFFKGRFKDLKIKDFDYRVLRILPSSTSRETYLEIKVY